MSHEMYWSRPPVEPERDGPEGVVERATELVVQHEDCPWCVAVAGELCITDAGGGRIVQDLRQTHMGRFAGLGDPAEYVARFDG